MKKYKIYVNSGYIHVDTLEKAMTKAKSLLSEGINVDISVKEIVIKNDK